MVAKMPLKLCISGLVMAGAVVAVSMTGQNGFLLAGAFFVAVLYLLDAFIEVFPKSDLSDETYFD